jgi:hypothetical protein
MREVKSQIGSEATAPRDVTTDVEDLFAGVGAVERAGQGCREIENRTALDVNEVGDLASASQIKKPYRQRLKAVSRRRFERIQLVISAGRTRAEHGLIIRWSRVRAPPAPQERAAEIAARTLALPDPRSVEDLTALLTSAGER